MSSSTGSHVNRCHSFSFLILIGQQILMILLRQVLIKTWIFFMVVLVVPQISAPYSNTGFTIVLKTLILVLMPISEDHQMFFSWRKAALDLLLCILLTFNTLHFFLFMLRPKLAEVSATMLVFSCICFWV